MAASQLVSIPGTAIDLQDGDQGEAGKPVLLAGISISHEEGTRYPDVEMEVRAYFEDIPILAEVARCESHFTHNDPVTGKILTGRLNPSDIGVMQINRTYHEDAARSMGVDIYSLEGNMAYARHLYMLYGTKPWRASSACWNS